MLRKRKIKHCNKNIATIVQKYFGKTSDNLCIEDIIRTYILTCLLVLEKSFFDLEKADFLQEEKYYCVLI